MGAPPVQGTLSKNSEPSSLQTLPLPHPAPESTSSTFYFLLSGHRAVGCLFPVFSWKLSAWGTRIPRVPGCLSALGHGLQRATERWGEGEPSRISPGYCQAEEKSRGWLCPQGHKVVTSFLAILLHCLGWVWGAGESPGCCCYRAEGGAAAGTGLGRERPALQA